MPTVRHVLDRKGHEVHHIHPDASVLNALEIMAKRKIGALVVLDDGHLTGIITERDYARKIVLMGRTSPGTLVREIMSERVSCVTLSQTVEECMALMTDKRVRHLPVLGADNEVLGILSIGDLVKETISEQQFTIEQLVFYIQS